MKQKTVQLEHRGRVQNRVLHGGKTEKVLILNSGACSWKKCYACGWGKLNFEISVDKLKEQVLSQEIACDRLKIFCSGSFFDDAQFPREFRKWFADYIAKQRVKELVLENLPQYITQDALDDFKNSGKQLIMATGIENLDPAVMKNYEKECVT